MLIVPLYCVDKLVGKVELKPFWPVYCDVEMIVRPFPSARYMAGSGPLPESGSTRWNGRFTPDTYRSNSIPSASPMAPTAALLSVA